MARTRLLSTVVAAAAATAARLAGAAALAGGAAALAGGAAALAGGAVVALAGAAAVLAACGGPPAPTAPPGAAAAAPLSSAADARLVLVPAGQYIAGSTPEERAAAYDDYRHSAGHDAAREHHWFEREEGRRVATLPAFRIDLMPVTQAQYAEFVTAGQAPPPAIDEAAWQAQGFAQDYATQVARYVWRDGRPPVGREEHPVVLVTWDEARRYCEWRGRQTGQPRRLPTSAEREKAARGEGGFAYPWGNAYEPDKLNGASGGPGDTTSAGAYPAGASPYGVLDLAGNVFEWTLSQLPDGKRVVKGSAWEDHPGVGRGAAFHGRAPGVRHVIVGFRCAAGP
jgi:formylglycine-generating enzyme required for sulfatase activity